MLKRLGELRDVSVLRGLASIILTAVFILASSGLSQASPRRVLYDGWPRAPSGDIQVNFVARCAWESSTVTYTFLNGTSDIVGEGEKQAVRDGMTLWSRVSPVTFVETERLPLVPISWVTGEHGDGVPFEGAGGVLAHTWLPCQPFPGDMHFDDAETWTTATRAEEGSPYDLTSVAAHEFGHALGLWESCEPRTRGDCSSEETAALMYPFYTRSHRYLGWDDIKGIQSLYPLRNGNAHLRDTLTAGPPDKSFLFGSLGAKPVVADWNSDGTDTVGWYLGNDFYLRNSNSEGAAETTFSFGNSGDYPIAGDWDGDGDETIGVFRPSTGDFYMRDSNTAGSAEYSFSFGNSGDRPVTGDWDGDGTDSIGVFRPSTGDFYLSNANGPGPPDYSFSYGNSGDVAVAGDWQRRGSDRIGVFRPSTGVWYLEQDNLSTSSPEWIFEYGNVSGSHVPITGDWDNDGTDMPGMVQN